MVQELRRQLREHLLKEKGYDGKVSTLPRMTFRKFTTNSRAPNYDGWFLLALGGRMGFPKVAWQDLEAREREMLKTFPERANERHNEQLVREFPVFDAEVVQENGGLPAVTLAAWEAKKMPAKYRSVAKGKRRRWLLTGFMMVSLLYPPDEIVGRFRKWLLKRHPRANKPAPEKRGRKSYRDRLNALGALRLRFYCRTLAEAQQLTAPLRDKGGLFFCDRTAWNRACARAVEYYREILDLPEREAPIHLTDGWRK